jgi:hypothetical protein
MKFSNSSGLLFLGLSNIDFCCSGVIVSISVDDCEHVTSDSVSVFKLIDDFVSGFIVIGNRRFNFFHFTFRL